MEGDDPTTASQFLNHLPIVSCLINYPAHQEFAGAQTLQDDGVCWLGVLLVFGFAFCCTEMGKIINDLAWTRSDFS